MGNKEYGFTNTGQEEVMNPVDSIDTKGEDETLSSLQEEIRGELGALQVDINATSTERQENSGEYIRNGEHEKQLYDHDGKYSMQFLDPTVFRPKNIEQGLVS